MSLARSDFRIARSVPRPDGSWTSSRTSKVREFGPLGVKYRAAPLRSTTAQCATDGNRLVQACWQGSQLFHIDDEEMAQGIREVLRTIGLR